MKTSPPLRVISDPWAGRKQLRLKQSLQWQPVYNMGEVTFSVKVSAVDNTDHLFIWIGLDLVFDGNANEILNEVFTGTVQMKTTANACAEIYLYLITRGRIPYPADIPKF